MGVGVEVEVEIEIVIIAVGLFQSNVATGMRFLFSVR